MDRTTEHSNLRVATTVLLAVATLFLAAAVLTYNPADWPSTKVYPPASPTLNACGSVGAWIAYQLFAAVGPGTYVVLVLLAGVFVMRLLRGEVPNPWQRAIGGVCLVLVVSVTARIWLPIGRGTLPEGNGGLLGIVLGDIMRARLSGIGTAIVLMYGFLMGLLFVGEGVLFRVPTVLNLVGQVLHAGTTRVSAAVTGLLERRRAATDAEDEYEYEDEDEEAWEEEDDDEWEYVDEDDEEDEDEAEDAKPKRAAKQKKREPKINTRKPAKPKTKKASEKAVTTRERDALFDDGDTGAFEAVIDPEPAAAAKPATQTPTVRPPKTAPAPPAKPYPSLLNAWTPPSIELLLEPSYTFGQEQEEYVREKAVVLEKALNEYRIDAQVVEIDPGPAITMYEVQLAPGIKVAQINALSNDLARSLKASVIRVISPIPGKSTIGIEVPNQHRETVFLRDLITQSEGATQQQTLPLFLGKDASGNALVSDLAKMPHLLVAGTTGSGKSVCLNTIILSLLMTQRPDVVKMILVDPKMVELSVYRSVPHLMCPIVTEVKRASAILDWAVTTMEERYELLAEAGVRNIAGYNRLEPEALYERFNPGTEDEKAAIALHMPHIIIIIDELADLMMTCGKEVEHHLSRLAQKSRAVGIHIIVATQRPEAKVVTGLIKSNLPSRIAFRVASRLDSRIVLDQNGAELLLGQGDMLFLPPGTSRLMRAQGTYIDDVELKRVLDDLSGRSKPEFHPGLVKLRTEDALNDMERDELYDKAVQVVLESRRGSVSLLQRKLTIGYSRASRLVEQMAATGIVGDYKGSQAREVLLTLEDWEAMQARRAADTLFDDAPDPIDEPVAEAATATVEAPPADKTADNAPAEPEAAAWDDDDEDEDDTYGDDDEVEELDEDDLDEDEDEDDEEEADEESDEEEADDAEEDAEEAEEWDEEEVESDDDEWEDEAGEDELEEDDEDAVEDDDETPREEDAYEGTKK